MEKRKNEEMKKPVVGKAYLDIGFGLWVEFSPAEKKIIMKMFEMSLDKAISSAKKSHRIKLKCLWHNLGCRKKKEKVK